MSNKLPLLVIEDSHEHFRQIAETLAVHGYLLEHLTAIDYDKLYNFKALHDDSMIVIVDLNLRNSDKFEFNEGLELIRNELWPIDRTTLFIVFSAFIPPDLASPFNAVDPHWFFVRKEMTPSGLSQECLANLLNVTNSCRACSPPRLDPPPHYDAYSLTEEIDQYLRNAKCAPHPFHDVAKLCIVRSIEAFDKLSFASAPYVRAGQASENVGIGLYGSCGRFEMRESSDVEISAYYSGAGDAQIHKKLAVTFWNRIAKAGEKQKLKLEGQTLLGDPDRLLHLSQVGEELLNTFCPVISIDSLLSKKITKEPQLRNRHWQVLTEMRPMFNPALLYRLKRSLVEQNIGKVNPPFWDIAKSQYFQDISTQFFMDTRPENLNSRDGEKRFVLRTINLLAFRVLLMYLLMNAGAKPLESDEEWRGILDSFCDPAIVKIVRFANWCTGKPVKPTIKLVQRLAQHYFTVIALFEKGGDMKSELRHLAGSFIAAIKKIQETEYFEILHQVGWLFDTKNVSNLMEKL